MKKVHVISKAGLITLWILFLLYHSTLAQSPYTGTWEGKFMNDFKTVILMDQTDAGAYAGKILMYSGEARIQDDEISEISIESRKLTFYIAAKETRFEGTFNESDTELSGHFVFPDQSKHPLTVRKFEKDTTASVSSEASGKESLLQRIPVDELKSDLKKLINKLKEVHPRLYSYTSEEAFDAEVSKVLAGFTKDLSREEFYLRVAPLVALVECSHTAIRLAPDYQQSIYNHGNFFPLEVFIQDQKVYCLSTPGVPGVDMFPGCEILSINQRPMEQIVEQLLTLIPAEGACMTSKYQELNRNFHSLFYLLDHSGTFQIEYASSGTIKQVELEAGTYSKLNKKNAPSDPYNFSMDQQSKVGVLQISTFGIRDMDAYFAFLERTFLQLKHSGTPNLMVDLRDNQGGHPIFAAQLFSYLTEEEFTWFLENPEVTEFEPLYGPMQSKPSKFTGQIYVLVNGACLSTTGHLISQLKYHTGALFIGENPGSSFYCNDFSMQMQLPHSRLEVNIPRTTFVTAVSGFKEGRPFPIDHQVSVSIEDVLEDRDPSTSLVYKLIKDQSSKP